MLTKPWLLASALHTEWATTLVNLAQSLLYGIYLWVSYSASAGSFSRVGILT